MPAALTVQDLMRTDVAALTPGTTLQEARSRMMALGIRHLPVIDPERRVIGMVSQRDLARVLDAALTAQGLRATIAAGEAMARNVVSAHPDTPASSVVAWMIEHKIGAVPVVDNRDRLLGIVTETDFLVIAHEALLGIEPAPHARA